MSRYFFNVLHSPEMDTEGYEFPDLHAAKLAAVSLCGELVKELDGNFWDAPLWRMEVTNSDKTLLFTLTLSGELH